MAGQNFSLWFLTLGSLLYERVFLFINSKVSNLFDALIIFSTDWHILRFHLGTRMHCNSRSAWKIVSYCGRLSQSAWLLHRADFALVMGRSDASLPRLIIYPVSSSNVILRKLWKRMDSPSKCCLQVFQSSVKNCTQLKGWPRKHPGSAGNDTHSHIKAQPNLEAN